MTIKPLKNQVHVEIELKEVVNIDPVTMESKGQTVISEVATVVSTGEDVSNIKAGDKVAFKGYALNEVHVNQETKIYFLDVENVLAIVE